MASDPTTTAAGHFQRDHERDMTDPEFIAATDAYTESIVGIARTIRGDEEEGDDAD